MARNRTSRIYRIAAAIELNGIQTRSIMAGIFHAESQHRRWHLSLLPNDVPLSVRCVRRLAKEGVDGLVTLRVTDQRTLDALADAPFKTFVIDTGANVVRRDSPNLCYYDNSAAARNTGAFAFRHLHGCGNFRQYVFAPFKFPVSWSDHRAAGFAEAARSAGCEPLVLPHADVADARTLARRLKGLPLPCAILAACDTVAMTVLEACHLAGLAVPGQVAVLGVDNDPLLCANANPPLSSVGIDHERLGSLVANGLDAFLRRPSAPRVLAPATLHTGITERMSTHAPLPAAQMIRRALDYIEANATKGISVDDVVAHLGISRRLAFLRFAQLHSESIGETIRSCRLAAAARALRGSSQPIREIARSCGFEKPDTFERLFKRRYGVSAGEWRTSGLT